ncbi:unnamed protein product, partial [Brassica oleracea]
SYPIFSCLSLSPFLKKTNPKSIRLYVKTHFVLCNFRGNHRPMSVRATEPYYILKIKAKEGSD